LIALASPNEQEWNQIPSGLSGGFLHRKKRAGIDALYLGFKENRKRKGVATRYNSTETIP
jgi:hypothetical protein